MSTPLEGIVRPFADNNVYPTPFTRPGSGSGNELVRVALGFQGAIKSMGYSMSSTLTSKMGQAHDESTPNNSQALQKRMGKAAGG